MRLLVASAAYQVWVLQFVDPEHNVYAAVMASNSFCSEIEDEKARQRSAQRLAYRIMTTNLSDASLAEEIKLPLETHETVRRRFLRPDMDALREHLCLELELMEHAEPGSAESPSVPEASSGVTTLQYRGTSWRNKDGRWVRSLRLSLFSQRLRVSQSPSLARSHNTHTHTHTLALHTHTHTHTLTHTHSHTHKLTHSLTHSQFPLFLNPTNRN